MAIAKMYNPFIKEAIVDTQRIGLKSAKLKVITYSVETKWAFASKYFMKIPGPNPIVWRIVKQTP